MAEAELPPPSYLKCAFQDQHNLVLLFGAACFSLAFATPVPLLIGAVGEVSWLLVGPRLPAFRAWVDRQISEQYLARAETAIRGALGELPEADVARFRELSRGVKDLMGSAHGKLPAHELQLSQHGLLELRRTFLDYLFLGQRVEGLVDNTTSADLEKEAAHLQEAYSAERELTARMTIRKSLTAVQRRISQQAALSTVKGKLASCLDLLEKALPALKARLADPSGSPLSQGVDTALAEIGSAETLELEVDEIFATPGATSSP